MNLHLYCIELTFVKFLKSKMKLILKKNNKKYAKLNPIQIHLYAIQIYCLPSKFIYIIINFRIYSNKLQNSANQYITVLFQQLRNMFKMQILELIKVIECTSHQP